ncbi:MAG: bifunctional 4-hydroxy-2-oxoglutarate aldolase/2-dehydro-3-deoxy-phosphogluconate aldolase, partial [Knoellia sp.]
PVIPVVVIDDADAAVPLAQALIRGGVRVMEVTLRTSEGLRALERVAAEVPQICVGAGTVTTPAMVQAVARVGASFIVLPGSPESLVSAAIDSGLPLLPGASTVTEAMRLVELGQDVLKFFPAEASGGRVFLSALGGPLPEIEFCPTGGITPSNARGYLALPNVVCVGGSWLTPGDAIAAKDWGRVESLAREVSALAS